MKNVKNHSQASAKLTFVDTCGHPVSDHYCTVSIVPTGSDDHYNKLLFVKVKVLVLMNNCVLPTDILFSNRDSKRFVIPFHHANIEYYDISLV